MMSTQPVALSQRPCKSLAAICLTMVEKCLLQAFYILSKQETKAWRIPAADKNEIAIFLHEKEREKPLQEIQSYVIPKLPVHFRQRIVDDLIDAVSTPEFDENALFTNMEFKFRAFNTSIGTSNMKEVTENLFKCLLLGFVTNLDFGNFYVSERCWVARARRVLYTWGKMNGGAEYVKGIETAKVNTDRVESYWLDMICDHGRVLSEGLLNSSKYFNHLTNINIDFVATGELVWAIGCSCPLLVELSLYLDSLNKSKYSYQFEQELIAGLSALHGHKQYKHSPFRGKPLGCPKLERIVLPSVYYQDPLEKLTGKLLCYLPHLKEVINVGITGAVVALVKEKDFSWNPLELCYLDDGRTQDTLEDVCKYYGFDLLKIFPKITSMRLILSKTRRVMKILNYFQHITKLEIMTFLEGELDLSYSYSKLTHFKGSCRWDEKKLAIFSKKAMQLEVFFFLTGSLYKNKIKKKEAMSFPKLRLVKFYHMYHIESEPVINFLKSTKVLTHIFIEGYEKEEHRNTQCLFDTFNDKVIISIAPALKKLVCFHARVKKFTGKSKYAMTQKSIDSLLMKCPHLTEIGNIFHWDIPYDKAVALKKESIEKNWCLNIFPPDNI